MGMADKLAILMALSGSPVGHAYSPMELPAPAPQVTIEGQHGGNIRDHVARVVDYDREGSRLRVTGACISACTLILALPADRICVGPGARFGFHEPFTRDRRDVHQDATDLGSAMVDVYPPFVQQWLRSRYRGLPSGAPQFMGYDVLRQHYPTCG